MLEGRFKNLCIIGIDSIAHVVTVEHFLQIRNSIPSLVELQRTEGDRLCGHVKLHCSVTLRGYVARQRQTLAHLADNEGGNIHSLELAHARGNPHHAFLFTEVVSGNFFIQSNCAHT